MKPAGSSAEYMPSARPMKPPSNAPTMPSTIVTMVLGVVGALLGGFIGRALGLYTEGEPAGFIMAVLGSIAVLLIYRLSVGGRHRTV